MTVSGISILDNRASLANAGVAFVVMKEWDARLKEQGQDQGIDPAQASTARCSRSLKRFLSRCCRRRSRASATSAASPCRSRSGTAISTMTSCRASPTPSSRTAMRNPASSGWRQPSARARRNISVVVDRTKAEALGITVGQVFSALSGYVGSNYVTQFNKFGQSSRSIRKRTLTNAPPSMTSAISRSRQATEP